MRDDKWGEEVRCRLSDAIADLHASDCRHRNNCCKQFMHFKSVTVNPDASTDVHKDANVRAFSYLLS